MKKKTFVTLMVNCTGVGITKDVGQIPQTMAKYYGYKSYLVNYNNDNYEEWRSKYAKDIEVKHLRKSGPNTEFKDEMRYIIGNARKIDVLNMYHMGIGHLVCLNIYKILNPKGVAYLKLDLSIDDCIQHDKLASWKKTIIRMLHYRIDIVTAESAEICNKCKLSS